MALRLQLFWFVSPSTPHPIHTLVIPSDPVTCCPRALSFPLSSRLRFFWIGNPGQTSWPPAEPKKPSPQIPMALPNPRPGQVPVARQQISDPNHELGYSVVCNPLSPSLPCLPRRMTALASLPSLPCLRALASLAPLAPLAS
ncbi:hypothetical protein CLAIMM_12735, partial [Cladophialophora immunda]